MRGNMNFCMYSLSSWVMGHLFFEREFWKVSFVNEDNIFLDFYAIFVTFPCAPFARTNEECRYKRVWTHYNNWLKIVGWEKIISLGLDCRHTAKNYHFNTKLHLKRNCSTKNICLLREKSSYCHKGWAGRGVGGGDMKRTSKEDIVSEKRTRELLEQHKRKGALRELDLGISPVRRWGWTYRTEGLVLRGEKDTWRCSKGGR